MSEETAKAIGVSPVDEVSLLKDNEEPVDLKAFERKQPEEVKKPEPRKTVIPDPKSLVQVTVPEEIKNEKFGDYDSSEEDGSDD